MTLPPRPDASMDLLNVLRDEALDPGYTAASARGGLQTRWLLPALCAVGLVFGLALASAWRGAPEAARERDDIIARIEASEKAQDALRERGEVLRSQVREESRRSGVLTSAEQARVDLLALTSGAAPAQGPGVRLTIDDGIDASLRGSRVVDADLRMAVNGLWATGAEAVAINGRRLSVRTPIRNAGGAITVDYRSLSRPYVVEAIGDAAALRERFADTAGGVWLAGLSQHYGVSWQLTRIDAVALPADPGLTVERASAAR